MQRRTFLGGLAASAALAQQRRYDIVIRNGELRDPSRGLRRRADLAVLDGRIAAIEDAIPASRAAQAIDAAGLYVTPGIVDLHTHCYHSATSLGIEADPIAARSGTTTWVDAGSFNFHQLPGFRRFIVEPSNVRIFGYLHLYPELRNPDVDPVKYVRSFMRRTGEGAVAYRDIVLGVKLQVGSNMNGRYSLDFLKIAREVCDEYRQPMMCHISFAPPETDQVMELMHPGDIVTHCFNAHTLGILENGRIRRSVLEARARGVYFDIGHGLGSFNFEVARKALDAGFLPDAISTDLYNLNVDGPVYDMPTTMSKMLHLGMSFDEVLERSTATPAKIIDRVPDLGTLTVGGPADIALLAVEEGQFRLVDSQRNAVTASRRIVARGTICRGKRLG
jgi:dihydroorotase